MTEKEANHSVLAVAKKKKVKVNREQLFLIHLETSC
jgi:hypothetical protein